MLEPEWKFKSVDEDSVTIIAEMFNLPETIARVMSLRGIRSRNESRDFFYPDIHHEKWIVKMVDVGVEKISGFISRFDSSKTHNPCNCPR